MCKVMGTVADGLFASEKVFTLETSEGKQQVLVSERQIDGGKLRASIVDSTETHFVVELPRETVAGLWRVEVAKDKVEV